MSAHVYHEIYLHLNWHVKDDRPWLTPEVEPVAHKFITERCRKAKGVYLHAINGTADHVHVAVNIEPFVTISDLVKDLKGGSSHDVNQELGRKVLQWQRGYGVVSFGKKNLPWVVKYIANQKKHHAAGSLTERLELTNAFEDEAGIG
jgi:putative transposase